MKDFVLPKGYSYSPDGYLWFVLPLEKFKALPETLEVKGKKFLKKKEFHVTVINVPGTAKRLSLKHPGKDLELELQKLLKEYVEEHSIRFLKFTGDLRLAISPEFRSIAALSEMEGVEGYFDLIRAKYGLDIPTQPTHVSIYTLEGGPAVGIDTKEEMESFEKLDLASIQLLLV